MKNGINTDSVFTSINKRFKKKNVEVNTIAPSGIFSHYTPVNGIHVDGHIHDSQGLHLIDRCLFPNWGLTIVLPYIKLHVTEEEDHTFQFYS